MLATALIVFREVLEAALVVGIVLAATKGVPRSRPWAAFGVGGGLLGASLVAGFAQSITSALSGMGQEVFNASVLFLAVIMLGWHNVWMGRHGREIAARMSEMGQAVTAGARPLYALAAVVGLAVVREGSETVLFLHGIAAAGAGSMLAGGALGLAAGITVGMVMYFGLVRIPAKHLFTVTSWMILLLAAGMAGQGAGYLAQVGILPPLGHVIWDTSNVLSERSLLGQLLHILIGYQARPDGIELVLYLFTLGLIGLLMRTVGKVPTKTPSAVTIAALVLTAGTGLLAASSPAKAGPPDLKVYSPILEYGVVGIEARGNVAIDGDDDKDGAQNQRYELEFNPTRYWHTALIGELEKEAEGSLRYSATAWENIIQVFEQGEKWLDFGLYFEFEAVDEEGEADEIEFKLLLERSFGRLLVTVNPIFDKEIGANSEEGVEFLYAVRMKWRLMPEFEPGIEAFGDLGEIKNTTSPERQRHQLGPVFFGEFGLRELGSIKYELGYLFGLTEEGSPDGAFKWLVEYEIPF